MSEFIDTFILKNKSQFKKYKSYIENNNWSDFTVESVLKDEYFNDLHSEDKNKVKKAEATKLLAELLKRQKDTIKAKTEEYKLQNDLIQYILSRLKIFVNKTQGEHNVPKFKSFIKYCLEIVKNHTERIDTYLYSIDITNIENQEVRAEEIKLTKECHAGTNKIDEVITELNIREDQATEGIQWLDNQKATIAMYETLVGQYPEIKLKLEAMGVDFNTPPTNTLHILNTDPPQYNPDKNFWEQTPEVLKYYISEYHKIDRGIKIDGYFIDGWLYFHFNYFPINNPTTILINGIEENKDKIEIPELRDNELMITDYFIKSKREQTMSLIAATRRAAKTTLNSSRIARAQVLNKKQILCAGGSSEDLGHIHNNLDVYHNNTNPAFKLYYLSPTEDGRGKSYGIKTKANKSKITTNVFIINLEGGLKKGKKESLAGFTPDEFILDEAYKFSYKSQLDALEPALWGKGVLRCSVLITGTGGDSDLAVDAIRMLNHPEKNKITLMSWDALEKNIPKDLITWRRKNFGLFLPCQMCVKYPKIKSNLADYLGIKSETLSKVPLWVTDWKNAKEKAQEERDSKIEDRAEYVRHLAYYPFDPEEIFLSGKISPFSNVLDEAKQHRDYLMETGKWDNRRKLYRNSEGEIINEISKEDLISFPFSGGNKDAPYNILEDRDMEKPPLFYYVGSIDFYKQEASTSTDSLGVVSIFKYGVIGDKNYRKLVATYAARPDRFRDFNEKILLLLEYYNARTLPEGEDLGVFQTFLENKRLDEHYLESYIDFSGATPLKLEKSVRKFGYGARQSKKRLIGAMVSYLEEPCVKENEYGQEVEVKRVQTIDDIHVLSEILSFSENGNFDRISSMLGGIGYMDYLFKHFIYPKISYRKSQQEKPKIQEPKKLNFFRQPQQTRNKFFRSR